MIGCAAPTIPSPTVVPTDNSQHTFASPSARADVSPSQSIRAAPESLPTAATPTGSTWPTPFPTAALEPGSVNVVDMGQYFRLARMANWGSEVWYTALDQSKIFELDVTDGTSEVAVETGRAVPWNVSTNGRQVVWGDLTPRGAGHADWSINAYDIGSAGTTTVDSGQSVRAGDTWDTPVALSVDGSVVAYAIGAATRDKPFASKVIIRDLDSGSILRQFDTDLLVFDIAVSGRDVAYSEGTVTSGQVQLLDNSHLMLWRDGDEAPVELAKNTFQVSFDANRVIWIEGPSDAEIGPATAEDVRKVELPSLDPANLSRPSTDPSVASSFLPVAAEGYATWTESSGRDERLILWNSKTSTSQEVASAKVTFYPSLGGDWLVWQAYADVRPGYESNGLFGLDLSTLNWSTPGKS